MGHWEDEEAGRTEMIVEQVGHRSPCTAICVSNAKYGVKGNCFTSPVPYQLGQLRMLISW